MVKLIVLLLLTSCSGLFFHPEKGVMFAPELVKANPSEVWLQAEDGTKLMAWQFPAVGERKGTILHFHGNADNMSTHFLALYWLTFEGFELLTFDYRGYGFSEGEADITGVIQDGRSALKWAQHAHQESGGGKFIVYGQSLGGAVAMRSLQTVKPEINPHLLILDSTFASWGEVARAKALEHVLLWPVYPFLFLTIDDSEESLSQLNQWRSPTLVIHSREDSIVPFSQGERIYQHLKSKKWFWKLPEAGHADIFHGNKQGYRKKMSEIINQI